VYWCNCVQGQIDTICESIKEMGDFHKKLSSDEEKAAWFSTPATVSICVAEIYENDGGVRLRSFLFCRASLSGGVRRTACGAGGGGGQVGSAAAFLSGASGAVRR
jgi:hypothetical protein